MLRAKDNSFGFIFLNKKNFMLRSSKECGVILDVDIPSEENAYLVHSINELNQGGGGFIRWASGGGAYLINREWVPLVLRSEDAATNPNKLTISSGRSDCYCEIQNPLGIIRELFEEIAIVINGSVLIPDVNLNSLGLSSSLNVSEVINSVFEFRVGIDSCRIYNADLIEEIYLDKVNIKSNVSAVFEGKVCLHISSDFSEINFLHAVALNDIDIGSVQFFDTEKIHYASGYIKNLNRPIYLLNIKSNDLYKTNNGYIAKKSVGQSLDMTPHAELLISRLRRMINNAN
jgi:hypothetical protein